MKEAHGDKMWTDLDKEEQYQLMETCSIWNCLYEFAQCKSGLLSVRELWWYIDARIDKEKKRG